MNLTTRYGCFLHISLSNGNIQRSIRHVREKMIAILDYDAGNVKSVEKALAFLGEETVLTRDFHEILAADTVIKRVKAAAVESLAQLIGA